MTPYIFRQLRPKPQYEVGQQVPVEWAGEWYEAAILKVHGPDAYLIHYNNFDES